MRKDLKQTVSKILQGTQSLCCDGYARSGRGGGVL